MERLEPIDVVIMGRVWAGMLMAKEITSRTSLADLDRISRGERCKAPPPLDPSGIQVILIFARWHVVV